MVGDSRSRPGTHGMTGTKDQMGGPLGCHDIKEAGFLIYIL